MAYLLIETSTERSGIALFDQQFIFKENFPEGLQSSQHLLPSLKSKLDQCSYSLEKIKAIVVGIGPGSYTGIRVGAVTAKALGYALKKPLVGLTTLKWFVPSSDGFFSVIIDAKIGGVYCLKGKKEKGKVNYLSSPLLYSWDEVPALFLKEEILISPNLKQVREKILQKSTLHLGNWEEVALNFDHVIQEVQQLPIPPLEETARLELLYLRETQAEIEKKRKLSQCQ